MMVAPAQLADYEHNVKFTLDQVNCAGTLDTFEATDTAKTLQLSKPINVNKTFQPNTIVNNKYDASNDKVKIATCLFTISES